MEDQYTRIPDSEAPPTSGTALKTAFVILRATWEFSRDWIRYLERMSSMFAIAVGVYSFYEKNLRNTFYAAFGCIFAALVVTIVSKIKCIQENNDEESGMAGETMANEIGGCVAKFHSTEIMDK